MNKKKVYNEFLYSSKLYLWIIFVLIFILFFYEYEIALAGLIVFIYLIYHYVTSRNRKIVEIERYLKSLSFNMDQATKDTLIHFPLPMVIISLDGSIKWFNQSFSEIFEDEFLLDKNINNVVESLKFDSFVKDREIKQFIVPIQYKEKFYEVAGNFVSVDNGEDESFAVLYWINRTELKTISQKYEDHKNVVCIIMVDNYEEVMQNTNEANRSQVVAEIDKILTQWASKTKGIIKKYERDKYICIISRKYLKEIKEKKFEILDEVKQISRGNNIPITLSIGIGVDGEDNVSNELYAKAAIDIALGRGGDQIVLNNGEKINYYGGNTQEYEKRIRVKARVVAFALREIITHTKKVVIMGHANPDIDCLGAAIGISRVVRSYNKECYIVLDDNNLLSENLIEKVSENEEYSKMFISKSAANNLVDNNTLILVLDTHKPSLTILPELLEKTDQIVVIDHHRRGEEFIDNSVLVYHEPYASSTCEMVTEIIQYIDKGVTLNTTEAESLYMGIVVDTKNFSFKTGVRTFEAAAYLREIGVNIAQVKKLFQDDRDTFLKKIDLIKNSEIYTDNIAIAYGYAQSDNPQLFVAQAADELLNIKGILTSFVLCEVNNNTIISARSLGQINVQVILEKLGGGGHLNVAGAQLFEIPLEDAIKKLKKAIDNYIKQQKQQKQEKKDKE